MRFFIKLCRLFGNLMQPTTQATSSWVCGGMIALTYKAKYRPLSFELLRCFIITQRLFFYLSLLVAIEQS